jgi:hypothetical protein
MCGIPFPSSGDPGELVLENFLIANFHVLQWVLLVWQLRRDCKFKV